MSAVPPLHADVFRKEDEDLAIMTNGLWALFLFAGMLATSLAVDKAREWRFGTRECLIGGLLCMFDPKKNDLHSLSAALLPHARCTDERIVF